MYQVDYKNQSQMKRIVKLENLLKSEKSQYVRDAIAADLRAAKMELERSMGASAEIAYVRTLPMAS